MKRKSLIVCIVIMLFTMSALGCVKNTHALIEQESDLLDDSIKDDSKTADPLKPDDIRPEPTAVIEPDNKPEYIEDIVINPIIMPTPPFEYFKSKDVARTQVVPLELEMISSEANEVIDTKNWFIDNDLPMNFYELPYSNSDIWEGIPDEIALTWNDLMITGCFSDDSYIYCTYGLHRYEGFILNIYDVNTYKIIYTFDFSNYLYPPDYMEEEFVQQRIFWAEIRDNILYVSHGHTTYAYCSYDMNAYITAIDLSDMNVLWRSESLVSNSENFLIVNDVIVTGYGYTDEKDYIYQLNIHTGETIDRILIKSAPYYFYYIDNVLFVRAYDTNYEFKEKSTK